jgi:putative PIN family toxin of toxin-antitoxin system
VSARNANAANPLVKVNETGEAPLMPLRAVIDTNVFLSSLWSTRGAAFDIFAQLRQGRWQIVLSNHLLFEYEEVGKRNADKMGLSLQDIDDVLDAVCSTAEHRQLEPAWIPRLSDPDDEPLLQMAAEAEVPIIVTYNLVHLKPAESFGIEVLTPVRFLAKLKTTV